MISASRVGVSESEASRARRCSRQFGSGMVDSRDQAHRVDEGFPRFALAGENAAPLGGEAVEPAPPLAGFLHPLSLEPSALFEAIQQRIQRRDVEFELPGRLRLDELADLVSVTRARLDDGEDDELGGALLELSVEHAGIYRCHSHICYNNWALSGAVVFGYSSTTRQESRVAL